MSEYADPAAKLEDNEDKTNDDIDLEDNDSGDESGEEDTYKVNANAAQADEDDTDAIIEQVQQEHALSAGECKAGRCALTKVINFATSHCF